jgi:hypothetical protein
MAVESVEHENLDVSVSVYNFQVEDWHTYYVGSIGVLVHNKCVEYGSPDDTVNQGTSRWTDAKKAINTPTNKVKSNIYVKDEQTALDLIKQADPNMPRIKAEYPKDRPNCGYTIHPIDNGVGLPHIKYWNGRTNGHVYFNP